MVELAALVDPSTTVVLTQECQRSIIGDLGQGVLPDAALEIGLVERVGELVRVGRSAGCRILHCVAEGRPDNPASATNAPILRAGARGRTTSVWDPGGMDIVEGIDVADTDITCVRTVQVSPIIGTEVPTILRNLGTRTVVALGVSSNLGIPNVAIDCVNLGFEVVIPRDAIVGYPLDYTELVIKNTLAMVAKICSTADLVEIWSSHA
jgi:nicotinamidase-related amidase